MKKIYLTIILIFSCILISNAQNWVFAEQFSSNAEVSPVDIKIDSEGDIYVLGHFSGDLTISGLPVLTHSGDVDIFFAKFDKTGTPQWARSITGSGKEDVGGLVIDPDDNIFVTGSFKSNPVRFVEASENIYNVNNYDGFLAQYNTSGTLIRADSILWGSGVERIKDITYDYTKEYLILVGQFKTEMRYDSNGVETIWPRVGDATKNHFITRFDKNFTYIDKMVLNGTEDGTVFQNVELCEIADSVNSYFATGDLQDSLLDAEFNTLVAATHELNVDFLILKFTDDLSYEWGRKGGGSANEYANSSGNDAFGNIYFSGKAESAEITIDIGEGSTDGPITGPGGQDYLIGSYNRNGNLRWFNRDGGEFNDNAYGMSVLGERILYTGQIQNASNVSSGFAVYDLDGNSIITDSITGDGMETGLEVAFDHSGDSVLVIGEFDGDSLKAGEYRLDNTVSSVNDGFLVKYGFRFRVYKADSINPLCTGGADGSIEVGTDFGTAPVTYTWAPDVSSTNQATGLAAGSYKIVAMDDEGRKDSITITLVDPDPITITKDLITPTSCHNLATGGTKDDGGIELTVTGGVGPYTYLWSGGSGWTQGQEDQTTLTSAEYYLRVTDANSCEKLDTITVPQPPNVTHAGSLVDTITIPPGSNGAVRLFTSGGTPAYSFSWTGPKGYTASTDSIKDLEYGGQYELQVTDSESCTFDTAFNIIVDTALNIEICDFQHVSCKDDEDGYAKVCVISGGTGAYSYAWRTTGGTPKGIDDDELVDIPAGSYIVKVTDLGNAKVSEAFVTIEEPAQFLTIGHDSTWNPSCYGDEDGAVFITVNGGWGGRTYLWNPSGKKDEDLYGVGAGTYSVQVSDTGVSTGTCVKLLEDLVIGQPEELTLEVTEKEAIPCFGGVGSLVARPAGGTAPFAFIWNDPGAQNDSVASNLTADLYNCEVTDANGCTASENGSLTNPNPVIITSLDVSSASAFGVCDGSVTVHASGGTGTYQYKLASTVFQDDSLFSGLCAGADTAYAVDDNGCGIMATPFEILEPEKLVFDEITITDVICGGESTGSACATATGGHGTLSYQWTGGPAATCYNDITAGSYTVTVTDENDVSIDTTISISEPTVLVIDSLEVRYPADTVDVDGMIRVYASGGTEPYQYSFDAGASYSTADSTSGLSAGTYTIMVKDNNECGPVSIDTTLKYVSVENLYDVSISVYPNPSTGIFTLEFENRNNEDLMLEIIHLTGQTVYRKLHKSNGSTLFRETIDLGDRARGTYLMRVNGIPVKAKLMIE